YRMRIRIGPPVDSGNKSGQTTGLSHRANVGHEPSKSQTGPVGQEAPCPRQQTRASAVARWSVPDPMAKVRAAIAQLDLVPDGRSDRCDIAFAIAPATAQPI